MAYVVTARWIARAGCEGEVRQAILALIEPSRAEPGNLLYQPTQDPEDPRVFFLFEVYTAEDAYRVHGESEHFRRLALEHAIPLLESRQRAFYETLDVPSAGAAVETSDNGV
jgi:quinol monooxygenase YgiN